MALSEILQAVLKQNISKLTEVPLTLENRLLSHVLNTEWILQLR